jgi:hypothetical protein
MQIKSVPKPNPFKNIWKSIEEKFGKSWVLTVEGWDKIKEWSAYLAELIKSNSVMEGIFTSQPIAYIAKKMNLSYDKFMPKPDEIKSQLDELYNKIMDRLERGYSTDPQEELDKITALYSQFLAKRDEAHKMIYNSWMNEWKSDPRLKRLFDPKDPFYFKDGFKDIKFLQMMEAMENAKGTNIAEIKQTYSKLYGSGQLVKNFFGLFKIGNRNIAAWGRYIKNLGEFLQRLIGTIIVWTPNTLQEILHNRRVLGKRRWIGLGVGQKIVMSLVWVPTILAIYRTIGSAIQDKVNSKRQANAKEGETIELMDWWLLDDVEWSKIMKQSKGNDLNSYIKVLGFWGKSWMKLNGANAKELGTAPAAWSLAAWAYLQNPNLDFTPKDFKRKMDEVEKNSKLTIDDLHNTGNKDKDVKNIINSLNIPTYDTLSQRINDTMKTKPIMPAIKTDEVD